MPFSMILIAAALTSIPDELYEAAALDGAGPVARFRFITLPAIMPALLAVACLVTIYIDARLRPHLRHDAWRPADSSNVLPLLSYQFSFQHFDFGRGAAIGMFAFVIVFAGRPALCAHAQQGDGLMSGPRIPRWARRWGPTLIAGGSASRSTCSRSTGC